jgi:hypothetical protein
LGEASDHRHIEYFQSLKKFHEPGLPCDLPMALEEGSKDDPKLHKLEREVQTLLDKGGATES